MLPAEKSVAQARLRRFLLATVPLAVCLMAPGVAAAQDAAEPPAPAQPSEPRSIDFEADTLAYESDSDLVRSGGVGPQERHDHGHRQRAVRR